MKRLMLFIIFMVCVGLVWAQEKASFDVKLLGVQAGKNVYEVTDYIKVTDRDGVEREIPVHTGSVKLTKEILQAKITEWQKKLDAIIELER